MRSAIQRAKTSSSGACPSGKAANANAAASTIRLGSRVAGWPASSRHSRSNLAAEPVLSPLAKCKSRKAASSARNRKILAQAAALCRASRRRSALAQGASRRRKTSRKAHVDEPEDGSTRGHFATTFRAASACHDLIPAMAKAGRYEGEGV